MVGKVVTAVKEKAEKTEAGDTCRHYWIIEEAHGPSSAGVCKRCGIAREFLNSVPEDMPQQPRDRRVLKLPELPELDFDESKNRS